MAYLSEQVKISIGSTTTAGAAGTSAITSAALDMSGWDGVLVLVPVGAVVSGAVTTIKAQQCATTGGSYADLTGTSVTIGDTDDDFLKYIDIYRPEKQFIKVVCSRATQNATIGGIVFVQYKGRKRSSAQGTNVAGETWSTPLEGTA